MAPQGCCEVCQSYGTPSRETSRDDGFGCSLLYRAGRSLGDLVVDVGTGPYDPNKLWALAEL